jgi:hypothetical protein
VGHARPEAPGEVRRDGAAEREAGEAQRLVPREPIREEPVEQLQVFRARRLAGHGGRGAVGGVIEGVHGEALGQRVDVADPVLPASHAAVKEHDVGAAADRAHRHLRRFVTHHVSPVSTDVPGMLAGPALLWRHSRVEEGRDATGT